MTAAHFDDGMEIARAIDAGRARLGRFAASVEYYGEVGSTNDIAATRAAAGAAEGAVVIAAAQAAGRGRLGRTWFSPPGGGLYVSVVLRPPSATAASLVTLAASVGIAEGIAESTGLMPEIKWPNDLLAPATYRKICGILVESTGNGGRVDYAILGFGLNLRRAAYPPDVRDRAGSLEEELGRAVNAPDVLVSVLAGLARRYTETIHGAADRVLARWQELAPRARGTAVEWQAQDGPRRGIASGIDATGALLVRTASGIERIVSGEVNWVDSRQ